MAFYIIVRHRKDKQTWNNDWVEGSTTLLKCIQTTVEVAKACEDAMRRGDRIFVHRCAFGAHKAEICASVEVESVGVIDKTTRLVKFKNQEVDGREPPISPMPGQNSYERKK